MAGLTNKILKGELIIDFYCLHKFHLKNVTIDSPKNDREDILDYFAIKNGTILKEKKMSTANPYFLEYMFNDFNLTEHLENKYPGNFS